MKAVLKSVREIAETFPVDGGNIYPYMARLRKVQRWAAANNVQKQGRDFYFSPAQERKIRADFTGRKG